MPVDAKLTIETPEQIALDYPLAGIGSRFMAVFADYVIQSLFFLVVFMAGVALVPAVSVLRNSGPWVVAIYVLVGFCVSWGYFAFFETIWKGQTPGKRMAGIRVIKDDGRPISAFDAIARNLMRAIDLMPAMYGAGCICMFIDRKQRRLGDLVAGTVVVHEKKSDESKPEWSERSGDAAADALPQTSQLSARDLELIETFLQRRLDLPWDVRSATAQRIAEYIGTKMGLDRSTREGNEDFLELIAQQMRKNASFH
jgi:uncharacterized RDD family membrane protein YckC